VIMTSNIGARLITEKSRTLGFGGGEDAERGYEQIKEDVLGELKKVFRPELLNRIDEMIVFHKLNEENIEQISRIMLSSLKERMAALGIEVNFTDELVKFIAKAGYDPVYGARPLRRAIQSRVEDLLSDEMLSGRVSASAPVTVDADENGVKLG